MSLTVGELVATLDADERPMVAGLTRAELAMRGLQTSADGRLRGLDGRFAAVGRSADRSLGDGIGRGSDRASRSLGGIGGAAAGAVSALGGIGGAAGGAVSALAPLATALVAVGTAVPLVAGLVGTLANIAPAAAIGATAVMGLAQAVATIRIGTSGIGAALSAAFKDTGGGGGGGGAASSTKQQAAAQRALAQATDQAAYSNKQAARSVADAERNLADAQQAALRAQRSLNDARAEAVRDLEDLNDRLADSKLSERDAVISVRKAEEALALARRQGMGPGDDLDDLQLVYDKAQQALKETREQTKRLTSDTAAANRAGVDGSKRVTDAQRAVTQANRDTGDRVQAVADAQERAARTSAQGLDSIRQAQEALNTSMAGSGGGAGAVDEFAEAMDALAPSARAFVRALIALKPAWDDLKLGVQQRLFDGWAGSLTSTATAVLPVLRRALNSSADALNAMGKGVFAAARDLARTGTLGTAMDGASKGLMNMSRIPGQVVTAFGQIAAAGAPQFDRLTKGAGSAFDRLSDRIAKAFASGGMSDAIDLAVSTIKQLGTVIGNVAKIIGSVFKAANSAGGSWLGVLGDITAAMAKAFASPEIQAALKALFGTMKILGSTLAPLVAQALGEIAPVLVALAPAAQTLIQVLGSALRPVIAALGPVLVAAADAVAALVLALAPLLPVVGDLLAQLVPILTPILKGLTTLFLKLAPPIAAIALALGNALTPVIAALGDAVADIVSAYLPVFLDLIDQMIPLIPVLTPVLIQLSQSLADILVQLGPLLPQFGMLSVMLVMQLLPALLPLIPPLAQFAVLWLQIATGVITGVVIPVFKGLIKFMQGLQRAFQPAIDAVTWLTTGIASLFEWLYDHLVGHSVIPDMVRAIVSWLAGLPAKALSALAGLPGGIAGVAADAARQMVARIRDGIGDAVSWLRSLPARARDALSGAGTVLYGSGQALLRGFADGIASMGSVVTSAASSVLSKAKNFFPNSPAKEGPFSGSGWTYHSGVATARDWAAGLAASHGVVSAAAGGLLGTAHGALEGAATFGVGGVGGAGAAGGGSGGGQQTVRVVLEVAGGDEAFVRAIRQMVSVKGGGSVQTAFGR